MLQERAYLKVYHNKNFDIANSIVKLVCYGKSATLPGQCTECLIRYIDRNICIVSFHSQNLSPLTL